MQHFRRTCRVLRLRGVRAVLALFESFVARLIGSIGCALTAPGADANRYVEDTSHDISAVYAR